MPRRNLDAAAAQVPAELTIYEEPILASTTPIAAPISGGTAFALVAVAPNSFIPSSAAAALFYSSTGEELARVRNPAQSPAISRDWRGARVGSLS